MVDDENHIWSAGEKAMRDVADGHQGSKSNTNLYSSVDRCDSQIGPLKYNI
jgi:hypothetical protein